jgi:CheY-like chemotaxis protein
MGGDIWIDSDLGKGSTFSFTFKIKAAQETALAKSADSKNSNPIAMDDFSEYHALLAEDLEINQEIVLALLEPTGLDITCANNGADALDKFKQNPDYYDLVLMDVQMPEMDGYTASRLIRELDIPQAKQIPIIAMTANVFKEDVDKALASGMNDHLGKPINLDTVLEKLRLYLKR